MATFLINPGIPSRELWLENFKGEDLNDYRICNICKIVMRAEDETEHCDECNICVVGKNILYRVRMLINQETWPSRLL